MGFDFDVGQKGRYEVVTGILLEGMVRIGKDKKYITITNFHTRYLTSQTAGILSR